MEADLFRRPLRRPLICETSQSFFANQRPLILVLFPSECTDLSGIVPGGPPRSLVMGVFPWKLNCIFLSHLLATANALSAQIRDRGLHNRSPLPRGVLNYGKLIRAHNYGSGIGSDQDDIPDEDENVSRRKKRAKADDEAHDDAADGDEDGDEDDDDDAGDDGDDDGDDGCGN